jgi:hypothetical protein
VPGLLVDQQDGLLMAWPLALLAVPGLALLAGDGRVRRLLAVFALHFGLIATYRYWSSGYGPAGRQLLPVVPLLAPAIGAGIGWARREHPRLLTALLGLNTGLVALLAWVPRLRYPMVDAQGVGHLPLLALAPGGLPNLLLPVVSLGGAGVAVGWTYTLLWVGWLVRLAWRPRR